MRAFDRREPRALPAGADFAPGDVLDRDALRRALDGVDAVFHLAALYSYARARRGGDGARQRRGHARGARGGRRAARRPHLLVRDLRSGRAAAPRPRATSRRAGSCASPTSATKLAGERLALAAAARGADVVVVNPTTPVGPGDRAPDADRQDGRRRRRGRARAYLAGSALNIVAVEDVARGHLLAYERGRAGRRYLLGGENLSMRAVFAAICAAVGAPAAARRGAVDARLRRRAAVARARARARRLLVLDEVRVARWPMRFDDARARSELGYDRSRRRRRWRARRGALA